MRYKQQKIVK